MAGFLSPESCPGLSTGISTCPLPPSQSVLQQPDLSLQNVVPIRSLSFNLFSFLPLDDLFETVRSWHGSAQNPPPHLTPTEMQSPANDLQDPSRTLSSTILPRSLCAFLKHIPTLRPLHWLLPQPRVIFLQLPMLLSPSCLPSQMSPSP